MISTALTASRFLGYGVVLLVAWLATSVVYAAPFYVGPKPCSECHEAEVNVWKDTRHGKGFNDMHKKPEAARILKAVGDTGMKDSKTCVLCHYTMVQKDAQAKPIVQAGPSCESCHGPASDWINVHNDYGGPKAKRQEETPQHKQQRIAAAQKAEMIWPTMLYDIASNCMSCHGLARPGLDPGVLGKMLDAKHPLEPEFELVRYSQGTVRHRFYPPNVNVNAEMTPAELSRMFVVGQAAKLVSATTAMSAATHPGYKEAQKKRADSAKDALKSVPEAAALIASPTEANARKFVAAIEKQDLSGKVTLPSKSTYK
jgi:hypothetical protein